MSVYLRMVMAHLPAFLSGLALVELLWPRRGPRDLLLKLALGLGLGWGVNSCLYFFWTLAFNPYQNGFPLLAWILALGLVAAALWLGRSDWLTAWAERENLHLSIKSILPCAAALLGFLLLALLLWQRADAQPNGNFDAYATWNLRARFLFLSRSDWKAAFSPALAWWVHADYPLLWPLTLLRSYLAAGRLLPQAGMFQAVLFGWATSGLFVAALYRLKGGWQAALGALLLLGMPWFINFSAFQQADVPLVYFYLACCALLWLALRESAKPGGLWVLAGLAAACAAWTKNDGLVFVLSAIAWVVWYTLSRKQPRAVTAFALGLLLPCAAILAFKLLLAPPGDLIGVQSASQILAKLLDPTRYATIALAILRMLPTLGGLTWSALLVLTAAFLLAGRGQERSGLGLFAILGLSLLGYCAIYLITPHPVDWQLGYSLDRLLFHLLIPALFFLLVLARDPRELWAKAASTATAPHSAR
jgi:hypothetical protein